MTNPLIVLVAGMAIENSMTLKRARRVILQNERHDPESLREMLLGGIIELLGYEFGPVLDYGPLHSRQETALHRWVHGTAGDAETLELVESIEWRLTDEWSDGRWEDLPFSDL